MDEFIGINKVSLNDFDGYVSTTLFTGGCNFKCPFCHNKDLVFNYNKFNKINFIDILNYLKDRKKLLDAVVITGGEPTLLPSLKGKIIEIKKLGYLVKLDTNGTNPDLLKELIENKYIDYVAMDIKNSLYDYKTTIGNKNIDLTKIVKSINYLINQNLINYEFRTTLVQEFHNEKNIKELGELIKGSKKLYLQKFVNPKSCIEENLHEIDFNDALKFKAILEKYIDEVNLRGYKS